MKFQEAISYFDFDLAGFMNTTAESTSNSVEPTSVYLFACGHFVKVGVAKDIARRLGEVQKHNPFEVSIIGRRTLTGFRYALLCEKATHGMLSRHAHRDEWFLVDVATAKLALDTSYRATLRLMRRHETTRRRSADNDNNGEIALTA